MDDPGEPGAQSQPEARVLAGRHRARPARPGERAGREVPARATASTGTVRRERRRASASKACASAIRSPRVDPGYDRTAPVYLADYATAEDGTGIVHSSPAYGIDDFNSCRAHGLAVDDILNPVQGNGVYDDALPLFGGMQHLEGAAGDRRRAARRRPAARELDARAQLSALLAPQDAGGLPRRGAVVRAHGRARRRRRAACSPSTRRRRRCANARSTPSTRPRSIPRTAARACTT